MQQPLPFHTGSMTYITTAIKLYLSLSFRGQNMVSEGFFLQNGLWLTISSLFRNLASLSKKSTKKEPTKSWTLFPHFFISHLSPWGWHCLCATFYSSIFCSQIFPYLIRCTRWIMWIGWVNQIGRIEIIGSFWWMERICWIARGVILSNRHGAMDSQIWVKFQSRCDAFQICQFIFVQKAEILEGIQLPYFPGLFAHISYTNTPLHDWVRSLASVIFFLYYLVFVLFCVFFFCNSKFQITPSHPTLGFLFLPPPHAKDTLLVETKIFFSETLQCKVVVHFFCLTLAATVCFCKSQKGERFIRVLVHYKRYCC